MTPKIISKSFRIAYFSTSCIIHCYYYMPNKALSRIFDPVLNMIINAHKSLKI